MERRRDGGIEGLKARTFWLLVPLSLCPSVPASKLRGDVFRSPRSVNQMHNSAVMIPDTAPMASEVGEMCSRSKVVPTAPTHQVRKPNIINQP